MVMKILWEKFKKFQNIKISIWLEFDKKKILTWRHCTIIISVRRNSAIKSVCLSKTACFHLCMLLKNPFHVITISVIQSQCFFCVPSYFTQQNSYSHFSFLLALIIWDGSKTSAGKSYHNDIFSILTFIRLIATGCRVVEAVRCHSDTGHRALQKP